MFLAGLWDMRGIADCETYSFGRRLADGSCVATAWNCLVIVVRGSACSVTDPGMLAATWWGVTVAAAIGVGGLIVGIIGLVQASRARAIAAAASLTAKDANSVARTANSLSEESNTIAREANDIAKGHVARAEEQHDVAWEWDFDRKHLGMVTVRNIGKNAADTVTIQFMYEDATEASEHVLVEGRETIRLEIPGLSHDIERERARNREVARAAGNVGFGVSWIPDYKRMRLRVKLRTELGTPHKFDSDWTTATLPL